MQIGFGVRLPVSGPLALPDNVKRTAQTAEELGYDSVWVHDFISWNRVLDTTHVSSGAIELIEHNTKPQMLESLMSLAWVAGATSKVKVGTSVLAIPYRHPIIGAKQIATLDVLTGGRLILGVGVGGNVNRDFEALGIPRKKRYSRTREGLEVMRRLWEEEEPEFEGKYWSMPPTPMFPKPVQHPLPIWFAGKGDLAMGIGAEFAQGWLPTWLTPEEYEAAYPKLEAHLSERGRSLTDFTIAKECYTCIGETVEEAEAIAARTMKTFALGFTVENEEQARASSLLGTPDLIVERVKQYIEVGVTHFEMKFIFRSMEEMIQQMSLFANEVIPACSEA